MNVQLATNMLQNSTIIDRVKRPNVYDRFGRSKIGSQPREGNDLALEFDQSFKLIKIDSNEDEIDSIINQNRNYDEEMQMRKRSMSWLYNRGEGQRQSEDVVMASEDE